MSPVFRIAAEEWRYWRRSRLGLAASVVIVIVLLASAVVTWREVASERDHREQLQTTAENIFFDQPARHPHRMVHYGHYVFRTPPPLALIDPGVDVYTGAAVFLEGHRQNSATFSPAYSGPQGGSFANLSPATVYQVLVPLMLIAVGFSAVARERERGSDLLLLTAPMSSRELWFGKTLALAAVAALVLLPLLAAVVLATGYALDGIMLLVGYALYLLGWVCLTTSVSARSRSSSNALAVLLSLWLAACIVLPRVAASGAEVLLPVPSKIEADLAVAKAMRSLGDGHNAADPAFEQLRANLLVQHDVDKVEDLPINIRGVVAEAAEEELKQVMDGFAEGYAMQEKAQADAVRWSSLVSPQLAIRGFSTSLAGTDLAHRHRFLIEAEEARYRFVQDLNQLHASDLNYADDIRRSSDAGAEKRTRVSSDNWASLAKFRLAPDPLADRLGRGLPFFALLLAFLVLATALGVTARPAGVR